MVSQYQDTGYEGMMPVECRWEDMEAQAAPAIETMKNQILTLKK